MGCRGRWKKIIHSEAHEFQILADENSQLNFWKWKFSSGTVLRAQASEAGRFPGLPGEGVCRIHLNQHFRFSAAKSVSGADTFLVRIMTDFLKILSLWISSERSLVAIKPDSCTEVNEQLQSGHKCRVHCWQFILFTATREYVKGNCDLGLCSKMWIFVFMVPVWALIIKCKICSAPLCAGKAVQLRDETGDSGLWLISEGCPDDSGARQCKKLCKKSTLENMNLQVCLALLLALFLNSILRVFWTEGSQSCDLFWESWGL